MRFQKLGFVNLLDTILQAGSDRTNCLGVFRHGLLAHIRKFMHKTSRETNREVRRPLSDPGSASSVKTRLHAPK